MKKQQKPAPLSRGREYSVGDLVLDKFERSGALGTFVVCKVSERELVLATNRDSSQPITRGFIYVREYDPRQQDPSNSTRPLCNFSGLRPTNLSDTSSYLTTIRESLK
jgi:hypothetical protein